MNHYVKTLKRKAVLIPLFLITLSGTSCADHFPGNANTGLLTLLSAPATAGENAQNSLYSFSPQIIITSESGSVASVNIHLLKKPVSDVSISFISSNTSEGIVLTPSLTFTPANYNSAKTLQIQGVDDAIADGNTAYSVHADIVTSDPDYNAENHFIISAVNYDNDSGVTPGIYVAPLSGLVTTESGGTAVFSAVLLSPPSANVTIPVASSNTAEGTVSSAVLTFTPANWNTPQNVTVTGADDFAADGNIAYTVNLGPSVSADPDYNSITAPSVSVMNLDNDTAGVYISPPSGNFVSEDGTVTTTFTAVLTSQPSADVTVLFSIDLPARAQFTAPVSGSSFTMTFTPDNWNNPQSVTVQGVNNDNATGNLPFTVVTGNTAGPGEYNNLPVADINLTLIDDEIAEVTILPGGTGTTNLTEGLSGMQYYVVLNSQPANNVTVPLSLGGSFPGAGSVSPGSLTFTPANWNIAQTVTVSAVNDTLRNGNRTFTVIFGDVTSADPVYNALTTYTRNFQAIDNDKFIFVTNSPISGNMVQGTGVNSIAKADHICNNSTYGYPGTGTYKALIGHTSLRKAYPTQTDWPLKPNASYLRLSDSIVSFTTNSQSVFDFGPSFTEFTISALIYSADRYIWTGLWYDWTVSSANCVNWTNNTGGQTAEQGRTIYTDFKVLKALAYACNDSNAYLLCVEQ